MQSSMVDARAVLSALDEALPHCIQANVSLAPIVRWKVGGAATRLIEPRSAEEVGTVFRIMSGSGVPLFLMGDASNLLFDSAGFDGVIMRIGRAMSDVRVIGDEVFAQAGAWIPALAHRLGSVGLSGLEHTIGIPGTLGGLIAMNGGSQRKGIGLNVVQVDCVDTRGNLFSLDHESCQFAYRTSILQSMDAAIVGAKLKLQCGDRGNILREMIAIMESRKTRFPKNLPNGGSTFLSDPALYATLGAPGAVIERLGLKGHVQGQAQISPQHANFIVNNGGAHSDDILWLIHMIRKRTREETGFFMNCEVRFVAKDGSVDSAHVSAEKRFGAIA